MHNSKTKLKVESLNTSRSKKASNTSAKTFKITNPVLKNIWETYFLYRRGVSNEDRTDHFNKMVETIKAECKPETSQKFSTRQETNIESDYQNLKQIYDKSKLNQQGLQSIIEQNKIAIQRLQEDNQQLNNQLQDSKQSKNKCQQTIIELSNKLYQIQKGNNLASSQIFQHQEINNTLDQYSAISIDQEQDRHSNLVPSFLKRQKLNFQLKDLLNNSQILKQSNQQQGHLQVYNSGIYERSKHPLKQSLQTYKLQQKPSNNLIDEIKRIKLQTERIMQIQNQRQTHKQNKRKMFGSFIQKPTQYLLSKIEKESTRRFKRIRG